MAYTVDKTESIKSMSGHLVGRGLIGQLGPDALPVVGEKVFSRNLTLCEFLDGGSDFDAWRFFARHPIANARRANSKEASQGLLTPPGLL